MNFLCLSDLHLRAKDVVDAFEHDLYLFTRRIDRR